MHYMMNIILLFEETYYDLARLLEKPLRKGKNTAEQNKVMKSFEEIVNGSIVQKDKNFYLKVKGAGEFEMGLVSRRVSETFYNHVFDFVWKFIKGISSFLG